MNHHEPIMVAEILQAVEQQSPAPQTFFDGTFGRGGHTLAFLKKYPEIKVWALDQDEAAVAYADQEYKSYIQAGRLQVARGNFAHIPAQDWPATFDVALLDLGVSSPQLDDPARGFSFYHDGPLDMRMDQRLEVTAADIVNTWEEEDLARLFIENGEVQKPYRVVRAIVNDRKQKPYTRTRELASLIERVDGWRKKGSHPATQYFLGLRMEVNMELSQLAQALTDLLLRIRENGLLAVLTFHSLEDRIVKNVFKTSEEGRVLNKKVIRAGDDELKRNPRARSAKLRFIVRGKKVEDSYEIGNEQGEDND